MSYISNLKSELREQKELLKLYEEDLANLGKVEERLNNSLTYNEQAARTYENSKSTIKSGFTGDCSSSHISKMEYIISTYWSVTKNKFNNAIDFANKSRIWLNERIEETKSEIKRINRAILEYYEEQEENRRNKTSHEPSSTGNTSFTFAPKPSSNTSMLK